MLGSMSHENFRPKISEKSWSPQLETQILESWRQSDLYRFETNPNKKVFSIDTPPPYVNTPIHIGQAYTFTWMDAIARYKRMMGYNVLFPIGLDRNGLPIEVQTEKEYKIKMTNTPREEFLEKARQLLSRAGTTSLEILKRLGHSYNEFEIKYQIGGRYETDDAEYRKLTQDTFIRLYQKGLIYEAERTSNYCPVCHTVISDAEVEYKESSTALHFIKFKIEDKNDVIIATTRPELIPACKLIIFNPDDYRYKHLEGKTAITPIFENEVKIQSHPAAKQDFGTGLMMICSYGDYTDIRILRELNINPTYVIDEDGRMNQNARDYKGLTIKEARIKIIEDLKQKNLLVKSDTSFHREPICWRSKNPIEFIPMKEIYLKQVEFKRDLLKIADQMNFYDPDSKRLLIDWINSVSVDWVISRRRYYGTEIPLWYCDKCGQTILPTPGKYYIPWKQSPPIRVCPKCGESNFKGETRIFDTWFDSSSSEQYILGYLWNRNFFQTNFPCTLRPQGKEIVRSWLYFTTLKSYLLFGKAPFRDVLINYHVIDEKGEKMSKSLGNVIDPQQIIKNYGAETFRIWAFLEGNILKGDIRYSNQRAEGTGKFLTKLWNLGRFLSSFPVPDTAKLLPSEAWILGELSATKTTVERAVDDYNMNAAALALRNFVWNLFADHYVEMVKPRAYGPPSVTTEEQKAAWFGLHYTFRNSLILLAPLIPFITDYLWKAIYGKQSIHKQPFPKIDFTREPPRTTQAIQEFNSLIWNEKKSRGISLKDPISIEIPNELEKFQKDLKLMHNIM
jgi:valyl-tRNA synthetase